MLFRLCFLCKVEQLLSAIGEQELLWYAAQESCDANEAAATVRSWLALIAMAV